jgi:adenosylcobinamide-GDP ribazoletransferase
MIDDLRRAFAFLTVLPVGYPEGGRPGRMFAYTPLVGLVVGAAVSAVMSVTFLPGDLVAFLALLAWVALTGGLHLDGFGDSCDGLLAAVEPARRLEIMKDSRAGSWAVAGLAMLLLGKWVALRGVAPATLLILPPVTGRWAMTLAAWGFGYARKEGFGAYFRDGLGRAQVLAATAMTCGIAVFFGWAGLLALAVGPVVALVVGRWAAGRLGGGLTGDVYGALCELTELLCLVVLNGVCANG